MKRTIFWLFACTMVCCLSAEAALTWRSGEGWVDENSGEALAASDAKGALKQARSLEAKEAWKDAAGIYRHIVRKWPLSSAAGEAQFKIGLMQEKLAEFWRSYLSYKKVVEKHPDSQFFDLAIERQYSIGNLYLHGEPQKIWKIPLFPSMDKTVEIFENVINSAPYGRFAAPATFKIGLARENQSNWSAAISSYNKLIDKYPKSEYADDAQYQIGYAWYKASSDPDYDQSAALKSIEAFQDFVVRYPESEKVDQAKEYITTLTEKRVRGSMNIAKFYEIQKNYKAAIIYYNEVVQQLPDSKQGKKAKERIEKLEQLIAGTAKRKPSSETASEDTSDNSEEESIL